MTDIITEYCLNCFAPVDSGAIVCPNCNSSVYITTPAYAITAGTVLQSRYLVGRILRENDLAILYVGLDLVDRTRVYIEEFYPKPLVARELITNNVTTTPQNSVQFKTMYSDILDSWQRIYKFDSTHIPVIKEVVLSNQTAYCITNHHSFTTLSTFIKNTGAMDWIHCKNAFLPLCNLVSKMHSQGFLHCGISPENILVTTRGELLLVGFALPELHTVGSVLTPDLHHGYTAPEQHAKNAWQGEWTDVYSMGAVIYFALTGEHPTDCTNRMEIDNLPPLSTSASNISQTVSSSILKAMSVNKDDRYDSINQFIGGLLSDANSGTAVFSNQPVTINIPPANEKNRQNKTAKPAKTPNPFKMTINTTTVILVTLISLSFIGNIVLLLRPTPTIPEIEEDEYIEVEEIPEPTPLPFDLQGVFLSKAEVTMKEYPQIDFKYEYDYNEQYPANVIVSQSVPQGTPMDDLEEITIEISTGSRYVTTPHLYGSTESLALETLTNLGVKFNFIYKEDPTSNYPVGTVIDMDKRYREQLDKETASVLVTIRLADTSQPATETDIETE